MNLAEMLGAATERYLDDEQRLTPMQVANRLTDAFEKLSADVEMFTPGQLIVHRLGKMADTRDGDMPSIFIRYLDEPVDALAFADLSDLGGNTVTRRLNCVIGVIANGDTFSEHLANSAVYQSWSEGGA